MSRSVKYTGKKFQPTKFGEGLQPGTVEWELNRRAARKQQREEDRQWTEIQAQREPESEPLPRRIWAALSRMFSR